jgi:uncharacterized membrane protein
MAPWILPTLGYILTLGLAGVTIKLALRTISWQQLVLWVPVVYIVWAIVFAATGARFPLGEGGGWAALTAVFASSALVLFFVALDRGDASKVVPVGSAYPVVTLIASAIFLSESITPIRVAGTALVVAGVVLLSR